MGKRSVTNHPLSQQMASGQDITLADDSELPPAPPVPPPPSPEEEEARRLTKAIFSMYDAGGTETVDAHHVGDMVRQLGIFPSSADLQNIKLELLEHGGESTLTYERWEGVMSGLILSRRYPRDSEEVSRVSACHTPHRGAREARCNSGAAASLSRDRHQGRGLPES